MSTISAGTTLTTAIQIFGDTTGNLAISTGSANTVAMTVDNSQNVSFANTVTYNGTVVFSGGLTGNGAGISSLNASNLTSGTVATPRLGSGTADTTTFLRGDNSWQPVQAFSAGTLMLFQQTSAPTGWTKQTTHNDKALRVVSGTVGSGGSVGFTTAFASQTPAGSVSINTSGLSAGATTLTTGQIPSHGHNFRMNQGSNSNSFFTASNYLARNSAAQFNMAIGSYDANNTVSIVDGGGSGGSHSHSISGSATGSFTGTAINLAVSYVDLIIASKD
jgi:hypothetical protein